jgi:hypothetical protein
MSLSVPISLQALCGFGLQVCARPAFGQQVGTVPSLPSAHLHSCYKCQLGIDSVTMEHLHMIKCRRQCPSCGYQVSECKRSLRRRWLSRFSTSAVCCHCMYVDLLEHGPASHSGLLVSSVVQLSAKDACHQGRWGCFAAIMVASLARASCRASPCFIPSNINCTPEHGHSACFGHLLAPHQTMQVTYRLVNPFGAVGRS